MTTTPPANLFALLNDDVEDGFHDVEAAVAVREEKKKAEATEKKKQSQKEKEKKKKLKEKEQSRPLNLQKKYLRAKRLVLPRSVIRSQIVIRKEKPEEETTVPSNDAVQKPNGVDGPRRSNYRWANGGNWRKKVNGGAEDQRNGIGGPGDLDSEGFQRVCSRRGRNGQRSVFSENNNKIQLPEETKEVIESNGDEKNKKKEVEKESKVLRSKFVYPVRPPPPRHFASRRRWSDEVEEESLKQRREAEKTKEVESNGDVKNEKKEDEKESLAKVLRSKFVFPVRPPPPPPRHFASRDWGSSGDVEKESSKQPKEAEETKEVESNGDENNKKKEVEKEISLAKVSKSKSVNPVRPPAPSPSPRHFASRRFSSDEVEKESSQQRKETETEPLVKPKPVKEVPGLDQFPQLTKKAL